MKQLPYTNEPLISVIIPVKNEEENLELCLEALTKVEFPPDGVEIIVVDNGSEDRTLEVAQSFGLRILQRPELNIAELRNSGAARARGKYVAFVDADIVVCTGWLQAAYKRFSENPEICCLGGYIDIPDNASWLERTWHLRLEIWPSEQEVEWVSSMNMIVKKSVFEQVGGFNPRLVTAEDVDLCFRMKSFGKIVCSKEIKAVHLGEAKTLGRFFRKESWRGQGNLTGVLSHGIELRELPSLVVPIFYLYFYALYCPLWLILKSGMALWLHMTLFFGIPLLRSCYICLQLGRLRCVLPLAFLWWLYYTARGYAIIIATAWGR